MGRMGIVGALAGVFVGLLAAPAAAHVTIDPPSVPKGGTAKISFVVPNESTTAKTIQVVIAFPPPPDAIPEVSVEPMPGWRYTIHTQKLTTPIQTDDGSISDVVSSITWTATSSATAIGPNEFGEFSVDADGIPSAPDQLVFRAVQSYTDGTSVRWVDPVTPGGPAADHPTPILQLTGGTETTTTGPTATAPTAATATGTLTSQDDNARALGVIGIVVGGVALVAATGALMRRRRAR